MKRLLLTACAATSLLAGCATAYQPQGISGSVGFTETQIDANVWKVSYMGDGDTKADRAEDLAMLRSAEVAFANGFTHFAFLTSKTDTQTTIVKNPMISYTSGTGTYGSALYANLTTHTYGGTVVINKPIVSNIVMMFRGKPELDTLVYDATFICTSIGTKYKVVCNEPRK
jgi:hypothetical protein